MYNVMHAPSHVDYVDTITVTQEIDDEKVTQRYVAVEAFEELAAAYGDLKRAISVAHCLLVTSPNGDNRARAVIEKDTGLTAEDAKAMMGVIAAFRRNS